MTNDKTLVLKRWARTLADWFIDYWSIIRNTLTVIFFGLIVWLLVHHIQEVDWGEVVRALRGYAWPRVFVGCALALSTYLIYSSYDLFGRYFIDSRVSRKAMMMVAFISCAFTLNFGAVVGSLGLRFRVYPQLGVSKTDVARIFGVGLTTNWLGYIFIAGLIFSSGVIVIPLGWVIDTFFMRAVGVGFLSAVAVYFLLCHFAKVRSWRVWGQDIVLPSVRLAFLQLLVASLHWMVMGSIIYSFLYTDIGYVKLLGVLLTSAIAGLVTHVPGAIGVLEAVFLALLAGEVSAGKLLAALIAYRAVYYLFPLFIALISYLVIEARVKRRS